MKELMNYSCFVFPKRQNEIYFALQLIFAKQKQNGKKQNNNQT